MSGCLARGGSQLLGGRAARTARQALLGAGIAAGGLGLVATTSSGLESPGLAFTALLQASPTFAEMRQPGFALDPILNGNVAEAVSLLTSSGNRESVASLLNMGPAPEAFGLAGTLVPPAGGVPLPSYPLTVRSSSTRPSAQVGVGPMPDGLLVGGESLTARAVSGERNTEGVSTIAGLSIANGVVKIGSAKGRTEVRELHDGTIEGSAESLLSNISVLDVLHIAGLRSTTRIVADAVSARSFSSVVVTGASVLSQPVTIDGDGVHPFGGTISTGAQRDELNRALADALKSRGMEVVLLRGHDSQVTTDGTTAGSETGSLVVSARLNGPTTSPVDVRISLGRSSASVSAAAVGSGAGGDPAGGGAPSGTTGPELRGGTARGDRVVPEGEAPGRTALAGTSSSPMLLAEPLPAGEPGVTAAPGPGLLGLPVSVQPAAADGRALGVSGTAARLPLRLEIRSASLLAMIATGVGLALALAGALTGGNIRSLLVTPAAPRPGWRVGNRRYRARGRSWL